MKFSVNTADVSADSDGVARALAAVGPLDLGADLVPLASALPGGRTASTLTGVIRAWGDELTSLRLGLHALGDGMAVAADAYARAEQVARSSIHAASAA